PSGLLPVPRLPDADQSPVKRTGANRRIRPIRFQCGEQLVGLFNRRGQVGVGEKTETAPRFKHAPPYRKALAAVVLVAKNPHLRVACGKIAKQVWRAVGRAVVHDNQFGGVTPSRKVGADFFKRATEALRFVVSRDDDAQSEGWHVEQRIKVKPQRVKAEGSSKRAKGRKQRAEGRRQKAKGRRQFTFPMLFACHVSLITNHLPLVTVLRASRVFRSGGRSGRNRAVGCGSPGRA